MWLQIIQLITISYIAIKAEGRDVEAKERSKNQTIFHQQQSRKEREDHQNIALHNTIREKKHSKSAVSEKNQEKNKVPKLRLLSKDTNGEKTVQSMDLPMMGGHSGTRRNSYFAYPFNKGKVNIHEKHNAKKSWNYFIYKMNGAPEDFIYPVKTQEIQREVCKTVPFSQNIIHDNCDKAVIQNKLCFGICNSLYVPNQRDPLNICSHCRPFKFTMNHLKLNCTGSSNVVKVIMMVEECKCVVHKYNNHGTVIANTGANSYGPQ
ncbi:cerberus [Mixophyes fleayi]|uniref:cerberus n=1 Tax=Mixophyes fleayi TaxID=3061075 RepID=UPI003F4DE9B5